MRDLGLRRQRNIPSPWPNGQGVGPLIQRIVGYVPLEMLIPHTTQQQPATLCHIEFVDTRAQTQTAKDDVPIACMKDVTKRHSSPTRAWPGRDQGWKEDKASASDHWNPSGSGWSQNPGKGMPGTALLSIKTNRMVSNPLGRTPLSLNSHPIVQVSSHTPPMVEEKEGKDYPKLSHWEDAYGSTSSSSSPRSDSAGPGNFKSRDDEEKWTVINLVPVGTTPKCPSATACIPPHAPPQTAQSLVTTGIDHRCGRVTQLDSDDSWGAWGTEMEAGKTANGWPLEEAGP
eukprot:1494126-Amphidinium_carterae.1